MNGVSERRCAVCGAGSLGCCDVCPPGHPPVPRVSGSIDDRFDELDFGGGALGLEVDDETPDLELDRSEPDESDAAGTTARDRAIARDRAAAAELAGFGAPAAGPLGSLLYTVHVLFRRRGLERERAQTRQDVRAAQGSVTTALARFARGLVGEAHRREMAALADEVGALYATVQRGQGAGRLPTAAAQEVLRLREAVRARLRRARESLRPLSPPDDGRLSFPPELLGKAAPPSIVPAASWLDGDGGVAPSARSTGDPIRDLATSLDRFARKARDAGIPEVAEPAGEAARETKRLALLERRAALHEIAPDTVDRPAFDRGWTLLASALGLVGAMVAAILLLMLVSRFRG